MTFFLKTTRTRRHSQEVNKKQWESGDVDFMPKKKRKLFMNSQCERDDGLRITSHGMARPIRNWKKLNWVNGFRWAAHPLVFKVPGISIYHNLNYWEFSLFYWKIDYKIEKNHLSPVTCDKSSLLYATVSPTPICLYAAYKRCFPKEWIRWNGIQRETVRIGWMENVFEEEDDD